MDPSATRDFLLVIHSNPGLSRTISVINCDFGRNSQSLVSPLYLTPPLRGFLGIL